MRKLWIALIAAGFGIVGFSAPAADKQPYSAKPKIEKPGRAADSGQDTVKSGAGKTKPGRAADEQKPSKKKGKKKKDSSQT